MFCFQCQETALGKGCTTRGVCGKTGDVANLQDLLIYLLRGLSRLNIRLRKRGKENVDADRFIVESLFMTITNANFDKARFEQRIREAQVLRNVMTGKLKSLEEVLSIEDEADADCLTWTGTTLEEMEKKAKEVGVLSTQDEDIRSLRELLTYGLKGIAAYAEHAYTLGYEDPNIYSFMQEALVATRSEELSAEALTNLVLGCGEVGVKVMALLDQANTSTYGTPEVTKVHIGVRNNPGILITGHDLRDLKDLLEQTQGTGVDVYTHSEMLPALSYPAFKKYKHLVGNYGNAWWKQVKEFETFNGPVLFTTNCLVPPRATATYNDRIYTTGAVGFTGFPHIPARKEGKPKDFSALIAHAKRCAPPTEIETGEIIGGFAHGQVIALADKVVEAVKSGAISRFFVMSGCDGRMKEREYYTEFARKLPKDAVILTSGCAKYRYNKLPLGDIGGIPRVLDAGQCNDSYSWVVVALKLKEIFGVDSINDLPITFNIAWYEQKAVIVLLALLSLGIKDIHLGPTLPAFLSPNVAKLLVEKFGIAGIRTPDEDLKLFTGA